MKHVRTLWAAALTLALLLTAAVIFALPAGADESIKEYTVTFVVSGNLDTPPAVNVKEGECVPEPEMDIPKDFSVFYGWYTSESLSEDSKFDFSTPITGDLTLYARLEPPTVFAKMGCASVSATGTVVVILLAAAFVMNKRK